MNPLILTVFGLLGVGGASGVKLPGGWFESPDTKVKPGEFCGGPRYLTWMADSIIRHGLEPEGSYTVSACLSGIMLAHERTGDAKYLDFVKSMADILLYPAHNGVDILFYNDSNSIDDIRYGHTWLDLYSATGDEMYKTAASQYKKQIDRSHRTAAGGFYHRYPDYADQMWLDGIYMLDVYYARWTSEFELDNTTAWDDIALQFDLIDAGTRSDPERYHGLPVHGFDVSKTQIWADPKTGAAPHVWGRSGKRKGACRGVLSHPTKPPHLTTIPRQRKQSLTPDVTVGWYLLALVEVLQLFPTSHPGHDRLLGYLQSLCDAIVAAQDERTKGWWLIMTPGTEGAWGNYIESSGSSMFVAGLMKALRLGFIEGRQYRQSALAGYDLMTRTFARESGGVLTYQWTVQTGSLSSNGTFEVSLFINPGGLSVHFCCTNQLSLLLVLC